MTYMWFSYWKPIARGISSHIARLLSGDGDKLPSPFRKWLIYKGLFLSLGGDSAEQAGVQVVFLQQTVELRAIAFGQAGGVGHVAVG